MKILITGGSGFVGRTVLRDLLLEGHEIVCVTRSQASFTRSVDLPVTVVEWKDPAHTLPPESAMAGIEAVVHLAGENISEARWSEEQKKQIIGSRVQFSQNIITGIEKFKSPVKTFISASAIGYYGDAQEQVLTEDSPAGKTFLSEVCHAWEAPALKLEHQGIRPVVLRVGMVLGSGGGAIQKMLFPFLMGVGGRLGSGKQKMSWIHIEDLSQVICQSLNDSAYRGPINAVAPNVVTNSEFTEAMGKVLKRPALFPVPQFMLKILFGEMAGIFLDSKNVMANRLRELRFNFRYPNIHSALESILQGRDASEKLYTAEQYVPHPPERVFDFFSSEKNLEKITPPWLNIKILGKSTPAIQTGTLIDYKLRVHGLPIKWRTEITEWNPNESFVDTQLKGPYHTWHHTHDFIPLKSGTLMRDTVRYREPMGWLGDFFGDPIVRRDVNTIFGYRKKVISKLFGEK